LVGAFYITAVCLLPEFLILYWRVPFYFGGTSLLIIVVVVMDFMAQVQAHSDVASVRKPVEKEQFQGPKPVAVSAGP
jgi:preprotein translocase subunit SecY